MGAAWLPLRLCALHGAAAALREADPDLVMHLAAESHVDRSIDGPDAFLRHRVAVALKVCPLGNIYQFTVIKARSATGFNI